MRLNAVAITALFAASAAAYPQSSNNGGNSTNSGSNNNNNNNNGTNSIDNPPAQDGSNDRNNPGVVSLATAVLIQTAVDAWQRDTGVVSNFLNMGQSWTDEETFKNQALIAHSAEVDELTHKNVLDQFVQNNNLAAANSTLSNGAFQLVVDQLLIMATQGRKAIGGIDLINKDRCVNVLPNIDTYFRESALNIGGGVPVQQSVRPAACGTIQPGVNGALKVNQTPQGYVNGKLQNGSSNTNPNIP